MSDQQSQSNQKINIELPDEQAEGTYSNLVLISHSSAEFVLDFTRVVPGRQKTKVYSRIIMAPPHAKSLLKALEDNIKKYENTYGEIKTHGSEQKHKGIGFQQ